MVSWSEFKSPGICKFGDIVNEYAALADGPGLVNRNHRGLIEITGKDRLAWLHNLTTNQVKSLSPGDGNYAFVLNIKGRILFDLNILVQRDSLWLDLDRSFLPVALAHLNKYVIMEDVRIKDQSDEFFRLGLSGDGAGALGERFGASNVRNLAQLGRASFRVGDIDVALFRDDFCGPFGVEFLVPLEAAEQVWAALTNTSCVPSALPVGVEAVEIRRIEAGIPAPGAEITDEALPAETGQMPRAVSFNKGCYLGQEVVERMRARHVVARQLVGLVLEGNRAMQPGAEIVGADEKPVGKVTSSCHSIALDLPIALGYVRTASSTPGTPLRVAVDSTFAPVTVVSLPFSGAKITEAHHAS